MELGYHGMNADLPGAHEEGVSVSESQRGKEKIMCELLDLISI